MTPQEIIDYISKLPKETLIKVRNTLNSTIISAAISSSKINNELLGAKTEDALYSGDSLEQEYIQNKFLEGMKKGVRNEAYCKWFYEVLRKSDDFDNKRKYGENHKETLHDLRQKLREPSDLWLIETIVPNDGHIYDKRAMNQLLQEKRTLKELGGVETNIMDTDTRIKCSRKGYNPHTFKLELFTQAMHIKTIDSTHKVLDLFVHQDHMPIIDALNLEDVCNFDTLYYNDYSDRITFKIKNFIKVALHNDCFVFKFNAIKIQEIL